MDKKGFARVVAKKKGDAIYCMDNVSQDTMSVLGKNISCSVTMQQVKIL